MFPLLVLCNKSPVLNPCHGAAYRSIVHVSFLSIFFFICSSLWAPSPLPPSVPSAESCDCGHRVTSSSLFLMQSGSGVKHSRNYKYMSRVLSQSFVDIYIYDIYKNNNNCVIMYFHLRYYNFLLRKLFLFLLHTVVEGSIQWNISAQHLLFSVFVSLCHCLRPHFSFPLLSVIFPVILNLKGHHAAGIVQLFLLSVVPLSHLLPKGQIPVWVDHGELPALWWIQILHIVDLHAKTRAPTCIYV